MGLPKANQGFSRFTVIDFFLDLKQFVIRYRTKRLCIVVRIYISVENIMQFFAKIIMVSVEITKVPALSQDHCNRTTSDLGQLTKWASIQLAESFDQLKLCKKSVSQKIYAQLSVIMRMKKVSQLKLANNQLEFAIYTKLTQIH